ncbi:MAG TPA: flagellar biosynthesis anti-sigma factor FlgM [Noviherbaspirillum sp.]|nr:flagellar biosynthesis anti-sigma factor FlgM [Noviherbaspirillum sp.]
MAISPTPNEDDVVKIDDSIKKTASLSIGANPARSGKTAEKQGVDKTPSDNVTLSPKAQALASQSTGTGVFDANKVNEIKAAIANGQFKVDAGRVAAGLIDSVKDLVSAQKG